MVNRKPFSQGDFTYDPIILFMDDNKARAYEKKAESVTGDTDLVRESITIIIADDDEDDRDLFKEAVETNSKNISVEFADDGKSLLNMLNGRKVLPDLIFLDLNMPNLTGKDCLALIRKNEHLKNIPVIIYSTSSSVRDIDETFEGGANLYITKPTSFHELATIVKKVILLDWNKHKPFPARERFLFSLKTQ